MTLGALVLSLALAGGASAAPFVEVTYDLAESTAGEGGSVLWAFTPDFSDARTSNPVNITVGDMKVTYQGSTTIQPGMSATITTLTLAWSGSLYRHAQFDITPREHSGRRLGTWMAYPTFGFQGGVSLFLANPAQGSVTANGNLKAAATLGFKAAIRTVNGDSTFTGYPNTVFQAISISVPVGSYGGKHWVDGRDTGGATTVGGDTSYAAGYFGGAGTLYSGTFQNPTFQFTTQGFGYRGVVPAEVTLVGREISRVPEPGSLLLLGSGLAGLAALGTTGTVAGRRLRRARRG